MATENVNQADMLLLSDTLEKMRALTKDADINTLMQDKEYFKLAEQMAAVSRAANTCGGIFFHLYLKNSPNSPSVNIDDTL